MTVTLLAGTFLGAVLLDDQPTLNNRAPWLGSYLESVVIIGLLAMVVIQMVRDFFPIRRGFQGAWIRKWIKRRLPADDGEAAWRVERDLMLCAGETDGTYLYNLRVEQLCGQFNVALQAAMENPRAHEGLIRVFARTASDHDLETFLRLRPSLAVRDNMPDDERRTIEDYAQARNHVAHHVERAVDGLQIAMGARWKLLLQITSISLCLIFASVGVGKYWNENPHRAAIDALAVGLIAGYLAPVAKDILARVQQGAR
jgi:hypothetical protein